MTKTKKHAILITGATKRLGFEFLKKSLEMGYHVIAHYRSNATHLKAWIKNKSQYKNKIYYIQSDLLQNPLLLIDTSLTFPVKLIGLINNASNFTEGNILNDNHLKDILLLNLTVPLLLSNHFFRKIGKGWIINITDAGIHRLNHNYQNYRISKLFLTEFTRQQAFLYGPKIRVNALAPGAILSSTLNEKNYFEKLKETVPLKSAVKISSLMAAYSFLIENPHITGQIINIDSGLHLLH